MEENNPLKSATFIMLILVLSLGIITTILTISEVGSSGASYTTTECYEEEICDNNIDDNCNEIIDEDCNQ